MFGGNEASVTLTLCASSLKVLSTFCLFGKVVAPMLVDEATVIDFVAKTWHKPVRASSLLPVPKRSRGSALPAMAGDGVGGSLRTGSKAVRSSRHVKKVIGCSPITVRVEDKGTVKGPIFSTGLWLYVSDRSLDNVKCTKNSNCSEVVQGSLPLSITIRPIVSLFGPRFNVNDENGHVQGSPLVSSNVGDFILRASIGVGPSQFSKGFVGLGRAVDNRLANSNGTTWPNVLIVEHEVFNNLGQGPAGVGLIVSPIGPRSPSNGVVGPEDLNRVDKSLVCGDLNVGGSLAKAQSCKGQIGLNVSKGPTVDSASKLFQMHPGVIRHFLWNSKEQDHESKGDKMTWDNHCSVRNHVKSALDKGLVNGALLNLFPRAVLCSSSQTSNSDHIPLCLLTGGLNARLTRCFKFEEGWTRDERSKLVVDHAWNSINHSWAPARAYKKLRATRVALLHWNRTQYGKLDTVIKELEQKLNFLLSLPAGSRDWDTKCEICHSLNESLKRKALYWKQRARISWLKEGDKCSKFFFLSTAIRGRRNAIENILNKDDVWISNRELIGHEFVDFFKGIFTRFDDGQALNCR
uniref:Reverse transcriptase n=1 Tax=Cannabis sativa TaxID=3483 RepID=A0A803Q2A4_CANSA